jgi:hypothetical protein
MMEQYLHVSNTAYIYFYKFCTHAIVNHNLIPGTRIMYKITSRMSLFNNATVAASFKKTGTPKQANENNPNQGKKSRTGILTSKSELMKQELLTGMTLL